MEIPSETGKVLKAFPTACRAAAIQLFAQGFDIHEIKFTMSQFIELENNLYDRWYRKMVRAIQDWRIDPETYAYELSARLDQKEISPEIGRAHV